MIAFLRRCWERRWVRVCYWVGGILLILLAPPYVWVNFRGQSRWREVQAMMKREGESLNPRDFERPAIPDEENFCALPALKDIALCVDGDWEKGEPARKRRELRERFQYSGGLYWGKGYEGSSTGQEMDWGKWMRYQRTARWANRYHPLPSDSGDPARDFLTSLTPSQALFDELTSGLPRPRAQWTPPHRQWDRLEDFQGHFHASIAALADALALRARAAATTGAAKIAHDSARIVARLAEAEAASYGSIQSIPLHATSKSVQVAWDICRLRLGSPEDFAQLRQSLDRSKEPSASRIVRRYRASLAEAAALIDYAEGTRDPRVVLPFEELHYPHSARPTLAKLVPKGWYHGNAAALTRELYFQQLRPLRDGDFIQALHGDPLVREAMHSRRRHVPFDGVYGSFLGDALADSCSHLIHTEIMRNQAILACALEEHFLQHGAYPESLAALAGGPWPEDFLAKKPMGYRRTEDSRYRLWSVGPDGKDDGGLRNPANDYASPSYIGDWVWDYPGHLSFEINPKD